MMTPVDSCGSSLAVPSVDRAAVAGPSLTRVADPLRRLLCAPPLPSVSGGHDGSCFCRRGGSRADARPARGALLLVAGRCAAVRADLGAEPVPARCDARLR